MNIPNSLTIARIFFVPLLVAVLVQEKIVLPGNGVVISADILALVIFWVAAPARMSATSSDTNLTCIAFDPAVLSGSTRLFFHA